MKPRNAFILIMLFMPWHQVPQASAQQGDRDTEAYRVCAKRCGKLAGSIQVICLQQCFERAGSGDSSEGTGGAKDVCQKRCEALDAGHRQKCMATCLRNESRKGLEGGGDSEPPYVECRNKCTVKIGLERKTCIRSCMKKARVKDPGDARCKALCKSRHPAEQEKCLLRCAAIAGKQGPKGEDKSMSPCDQKCRIFTGMTRFRCLQRCSERENPMKKTKGAADGEKETAKDENPVE